MWSGRGRGIDRGILICGSVWAGSTADRSAPNLGPLWDHTLCAMANDLRLCERLAASTTADDQGERLTAMFWGSSGRGFFKSCQPDSANWGLTCGNRRIGPSHFVERASVLGPHCRAQLPAA